MPPLATELFDYVLPPHLIAQVPAARRDASRLLVVDRATRSFAHHTFADLPKFLRPGDTLFRNNAAVLPARLHALRPTGGHVECLLLRPAGNERDWTCMVKPGRKLPIGSTFVHPAGAFRGEVIAKEPDGTAVIRFSTEGDDNIVAVANRVGDVPLPPYIARASDNSPAEHAAQRAADLDRYQTVYANHARQVAVAAPTAGLHFTPDLLSRLAGQRIRTADITLHVGLGTFKPIGTPTVDQHIIHREVYEISVATQRALFAPLSGRRIAVGTTSVRTIEDFLGHHQAPSDRDEVAYTALFVYPPWSFRGVDALITNFHQPRSTLLCLVAAFLAPGRLDGIAWIRELYAEAITQEYRFFSYGDAMLIL